MRFTPGIVAVPRISGTPPTLSSASAVFRDIFVWLKVTTDTDSGTLFAVVCPAAASAPSGAQIEAGTDGSNNPATSNANVAISSLGAKALQLRGLTAGTAYKVYATHKNAAGYSAVVNVAFTSDLLIHAVAVIGASPGLIASTGCAAFSGDNLSRDDPYGGTNACRYMDTNDSVSGGVIHTWGTITYFNGLCKFCYTTKYVSGAAHLRMATANISVVGSTHWNTSTGALGTNAALWVSREVFNVGSGWLMWTAEADVAGADLSGSFNVSKGATDNSASAGTRNGTHISDVYEARITRVGP